MKKLLLLAVFFLFFGSFSYSQMQNLVLFHDTTVTTSLTKRMADRDTLASALNTWFTPGSVTWMYFNNSTNLSDLGNYRSIFLVETSFDGSTTRALNAASKDSLKAWLTGGTAGNKRALINIGADQGYNYSRTGSTYIDTALTSGLLKFSYRLDNGNITTNNAITGVAVEPGMDRGMTTSPVGSGFYPDGVEPLAGSSVLYTYKGRGASDSVASVGVNTPGYVAASLFQDPRYFTGDFKDVLFNLVSWASANGGTFVGVVPVELTSFAAAAVGNSVKLNWSTATEINNSGFEIERRTSSSDFSNIGFVGGFGSTTEAKAYSFEDNKLSTGKYYYRLKQIDFDGSFEYSDEVEVDVLAPAEFALMQNFPNPFNPSTLIKYSLPLSSFVNISIYNALGEKVAELVNESKEAGEYEVSFNASDLSSGLYFYKIEAGKNSAVKKMMLMK